jgi:hypothetical protein
MVSSVAATLLLFATTAQGLGPIPGEERFAGLAEKEGKNSAGAGLGFGKIGDDYFLQLVPRLDLNFGKVGLGINVPLQLEVYDDLGRFRREDWNEISDFLRVIRYVRYGHKRSDDLLYVRVGEIAAELGHGTIMTRYLNNVDVDTFRLGSQLDVYTKWGGVETVVSDYGTWAGNSPESMLMGARLYVKPYAFVDPDAYLNMFAVGLSAVSDLNAPRRLEGDLDDKGNFEVATAAPLTVYGVDLEAQVLRTDMVKLTPYTDLNFISNAGWGWHLGTLFEFRFPIGFELTIPVRLEYRRFASDYIPAYFSTFYEIERYAFVPAGRLAPPKAAVVSAAADDEGINGYYGDLAFSFAGMFQIGAVYEDYDGADPNLAAFLAVPALEVIQFKAYYTRTGIRGWGDIFALDNRSLLVAEARYEVVTFIYLVGRFTRHWVPRASGEGFESTDDFNVGVEAAFTF